MNVPNTVSIDIPDLKKKENSKERKGSGFLWPGGRLASELGHWAGGSSSWLGGLLLSPAGPIYLLAGLAGITAGAAAGGIWALSVLSPASSSSREVASASSSLDGVGPSGIHIYRPQNASLQDLRKANAGSIKVYPDDNTSQSPNVKDAGKDSKQDAAGANQKEGSGTAEKTPQDQAGLLDSVRAQMGAGLDRNQFIAKLSGNSNGNRLGTWSNLSKNMMGEQDNNFQMKSKIDGIGIGTSVKKFSNGPAGKLSTPMRRPVALSSSKLGRNSAFNAGAGRQLAYANNLSVSGATAGTTEAQQTYASDAFDQQASAGSGISAGGTGTGTGSTTGAGVNSGSTAPPLGTGAPNVTPPPSVGSGTNVTPYQGLLDSAKNMDSGSAMMKIISVILIAAGIALIASGGIFGIIAGIALIAAGGMMLMQAMNMANKLKNISSQIQNAFGQATQAQTANNCASQAVSNGTSADQCNSTQPTQLNNTNVSTATQAEQTKLATPASAGNGSTSSTTSNGTSSSGGSSSTSNGSSSTSNTTSDTSSSTTH